jgi:hypothetical protein
MLPVPLVLFLALIISLVVFVPLTGVLVRFRANYNPKGLQLDSDGGAVPYTGPVLRSYFGMMIRVYRLEVRMQMFLFLVQPKVRHLGGFRPLQRIEYVTLPFHLHVYCLNSIAVPTAISSFIVAIIVLLFIDTEHPRHGKYRAPETGILVSSRKHSLRNKVNRLAGNSNLQSRNAGSFATNGYSYISV